MWQTMVAHRDPGNDVRYLSSILRDLRPQKQLEAELLEYHRALQALNTSLEARIGDRTRRLQEVNDTLESFAFIVAEDLKTPLRGIRAFTRQLLTEYDGQLPAEAVRWIEEISALGGRMSQLSEELVQHSRIANREPTIARLVLGEVLERVLAERQGDIDTSGVVVDPISGRHCSRCGLVLFGGDSAQPDRKRPPGFT